MTQVELSLPSQNPQHEDPTGFRIGWDHAHHGLVPPPELLLEGTPIGQGWRAARAVFAGRSCRSCRSWPATRHTRQWLALRIEAWRAGVEFDLQTVTPNHLAQIEVSQCPATRIALGGATDSPSAAQIARLNPHAAYAAGNLAMLSRAADRAWRGLEVMDLVRRARAAELSPDGPGRATLPGDLGADDLDAATWWRLAALRSFATPLPTAEAARLPLAALPPNRARVLNTAQALQALLTWSMASADWCKRMAEVAAHLPAHSLRTDFNLWVGALAPRVLEAQARGGELQRALEEAWLGERVQRRWLHFVLSLGEPACEQLVQRLAELPLPGRKARVMAHEQAVDGWALPTTPGTASLAFTVAALPLQAAAQHRAPRKTARTPSVPRPRATTAPRPAAR